MSTTVSNQGIAVSPLQLNELEGRLSYPLPTAYRQFLLQTNGGIPTPDHYRVDGFGEAFSDIQQLFGVGVEKDDIEEALTDFSDRLPSGFLPIGRSSTNDLVCISLRPEDHGTVYFWDSWEASEIDPIKRSGVSNLYFVAEDVDQFLSSLRPYQMIARTG